MIILDKVGKTYHAAPGEKVVAVDEVTLQIPFGGITVLRGPSGSGKTSLLSLIGCMARPTSGVVRLNERDISRLPERFLTAIRRQTFGFIFQHFQLIRDLSVLDNVLLPLMPLPTGFREMRQRAEEVMAPLGLLPKQHRKAKMLSGGEQQRVAIARALICNPDVIIADEPTAHLDSQLSADLLEIFTELNAAGKTLVIATHDPLVAEHASVTQLVEMRDGRMLRESHP
jgi:putative ABC transport system ATP-binding protein